MDFQSWVCLKMMFQKLDLLPLEHIAWGLLPFETHQNIGVPYVSLYGSLENVAKKQRKGAGPRFDSILSHEVDVFIESSILNSNLLANGTNAKTICRYTLHKSSPGG